MSVSIQFGGRKGVPSARSIQGRKAAGGWFAVGFGLLFVLIGGFGTWFFSANTWQRMSQTKSWAEVPVVIVESKVASSRSSDGTNYRPDITFSYEWEGRPYESNSWRLMSVSSSSRGWARDVVEIYAAGSHHTAWVNPSDPGDAVLDRSLGMFFFLTFIPVVFLCVGVAVAGFGLKSKRGRRVAKLVRSGDSLADGSWRDGKLLGLPELPAEGKSGAPVGLVPRQGPLVRLLSIFVFALFWNGVTWTILGMLLIEGRRDGFELFPILFLSLFALIGAVMVGVFVYTLLGFLFGPRARVTAVARVLKPGDSWEVSWQFTRGSGRIRELRLTLEGQTEGEYTRSSGKNSSRVTDKKVFLRREIFVSAEPGEIVRGTARVELPADLPHSFEAASNRIRYQVCLVAAVSLMPNLREEYPVFVPPAVNPSTS